MTVAVVSVSRYKSKSEELFERAKKVIPGGVNSPVRAFEPHPFFTKSAKGSKITDEDGRIYTDYCMAYGSLIFGHSHPEVIEAIRQQLEAGSLYGTPTQKEVELAELITKTVPCMQMVRLANSGAEATMHAIRTARAFTRRDKIVKFEGCYHGAHDYVLVQAGSGATTFGTATSAGIPEDTIKNTIVLPFNDVEALEDAITRHAREVAAVIIEPVMGNAGLILPSDGYLHTVRRITEEKGILLIFDEVITGFRLALGGAQQLFGIMPDMACLSKILGGGFPLAAFGGKREIMENISPRGKVYQAGTYSGNPISVTAALTTLKLLERRADRIYSDLADLGLRMSKGLKDLISDRGIGAQVNSLSSMFQIFFTDKRVLDYASAKTSDTKKFLTYFKHLLDQGVFVPPSQFETCFISAAHAPEDVDATLDSMDSALSKLR